MISFFSTLFGALLAILGGFLQQAHQNNLSQKREDRELLFKAVDILINMQSTLDDLPASRVDMKEPCKKLLLIGSRIYAKSNSDIADKIVEFARMPGKWTKDEANKLLQEVAEVCSKPLDRSHKKFNELIAKVAEELKPRRESEEK